MALWVAGLGTASYQLQAWQGRLSEVLIQLQADSLMQSKASLAGQGVRPEWYRHRALTLLAAVEHLHEDALWTWVMPGSWRIFDDLEERAADRIGQAFAGVVVETVRREIEKRAAALTGVARDPYTAAIDASPGCQGPHPSGIDTHRETLSVAQMPEYQSMANFLREVTHMDRAMASLRALQRGPSGQVDDLRRVIRYSLGADLSQPASRSLALFRARPDPADPTGQALASRLQDALHCTARRGVEALHERLVDRNPLLDGEAAIAKVLHENDLFSIGTARERGDDVARVRIAANLIEAQNTLLAGSEQEWMHPGATGLGHEHAGLLEQVQQIDLLGPALAIQLAQDAQRHRAELHEAIRAHTARPHAGLAWDQTHGRLVTSTRRMALYAGLVALLDEPLWQVPPPLPGPSPLAALIALSDDRARFFDTKISLFPPDLQPVVGRYAAYHFDHATLVQARRFLSDGRTRLEPSETLNRIFILESALRESGVAPMAQWLADRLLAEAFICGTPAAACRQVLPKAPGAPSDSAGGPAVRPSAGD